MPMAWHGFGSWKRPQLVDMRFLVKQNSNMQCWPANLANVADFVMPIAK